MASTAPIGVFDSGLGGISVAREIRRDMPNEHVLYFVFELTVLNSMLLYMIKKHEHICEDFSKQL